MPTPPTLHQTTPITNTLQTRLTHHLLLESIIDLASLANHFQPYDILPTTLERVSDDPGVYVCTHCVTDEYAICFHSKDAAQKHRRNHDHRDCWLKRLQRPSQWPDPVVGKPLKPGDDGRVTLPT